MITVTDNGNKIFVAAMTGQLYSFHLFTENGEMSTHGYDRKLIDPALWKDGAYPEIVWVFQADEQPVQVKGWYASDVNGSVVLSELFQVEDEGDYLIKRTDDKIKVTPRLSLIAISAE